MWVLATFSVGIFENRLQISEFGHTSLDIFGDRGDMPPLVHQDNLNSVPHSEELSKEVEFEQT